MKIAFLNRYGVKGGLLPIAPEDQKILADGATDMRRARDQRLLDIQDELSSNHMLGQLPKQVAPMTGADLCKALGK